MDFATIAELIATIGFPIVCCGALFYQQNRTMKDFSDRIEKSTKEIADNVEKNTIAVNTLVTTVSVLHKKDGD